MVPEAPMEDGPSGRKPAGDGWFIVNARDAEWLENEKFGYGVVFESSAAQFPHYGINVQVLMPGQPNCYYHAEEGQEDFLVLSGECLVLIEGEERRLKAWDLVHCPPFVEHVFVGAGEGPCVFLAVGARNAGEGLVYPVSELALRHQAGVEEEATTGKVAYAGTPETKPRPYPGGFLGEG
ncbi:MAG TPA: cupin domain-containing protein [Gaiellales bacterium]|nr:cupin domain-containing protein [Gaiellales bacterium]